MRPRWLRVLFRRRVWTILLLVLQVWFFVNLIVGGSQLSRRFSGILTVISVVAVLYIVSKKDKGAYKTAWAILILTVPLFGGLLYLLFHLQTSTRRFSKDVLHAQRKAEVEYSAAGDDYAAAAEALPEHLPQIRYLQEYAGFPIYADTETHYLTPGERKLEALLRELRKAERYIFLEYFIIQPGVFWNSVLEILEEKAAQGVEVRLIYDDMGCMFTLPRDYNEQMAARGIQCRVFNRFVPVMSLRFNNRDHRKFLIIDGKVGFTGGINLADEYINRRERFGHWKDSAILLEGDAVWSMTVMFLTMWDHCCGWEEEFHHFRPEPAPARPWTGYVQPYTDTPLDREAVGQAVYLNMIGKARKYIYITTPYLVIDVATNTALCNAAKSGVDVRIITPHIPDKRYVFEVTRAHYPPLLEAGVRIYEYTPGFIHAKNFVVDDRFATVGTVNLDYRSLFLHFEDGVWLCEAPCIQDIRRDIEETLRVCQRISLRQRKYFNPIIQLYRNILRIFAPLM